ncbi:hypothetical protein [Segatella paludivivens]|uniref:hypothetical protein n=1 Tax=Segatella paludivivens TaxID=185294 RepID=UPI0003615C80|nr:hypothetical protein [Segatella paludivivens]
MKKYKTLEILVYCCFISLSLFSCGDKEDYITPEAPAKNYFAAYANATDDESLLRKEFYKNNGCYLLFNDTLRHDSIGVKPNGEITYQTETIDVPYIMSSQAYFAYKYTYIKDIEKQKAAANFIENNILPHLSAKLRPYSWLLVNSITKYAANDNSYSYDSEQTSVVGNRATAIGIQDIFDMDESDIQLFAKDLCASIVADKVSSLEASIIAPFTKFSDSFYETTSQTTPSDNESNMELMQESGFICPYTISGIVFYGYYPSKVEDIKAFAKLVVENDEQYVRDTYNNEIILQKYMVMKNIILSLGYKF